VRQLFTLDRPPTLEAGSKLKPGKEENNYTKHTGQQIEMERDDSIMLAFSVADLGRVKRRLIGFGGGKGWSLVACRTSSRMNLQ
jgi:hypothetical protein